MANVYVLNTGSKQVGQKTRVGISLQDFVKNIDDKLKSKVLDHLEKEALYKLVFKFRKHIDNGGYGITAKQAPKYMSIRKWSGEFKRNGDGKVSLLFKNNALDKAGSFPYVTTLYTGTDHQHYPNGYAAQKQGLTKEKVTEIKNDINKTIENEVRTALKGLTKWVRYKIK